MLDKVEQVVLQCTLSASVNPPIQNNFTQD